LPAVFDGKLILVNAEKRLPMQLAAKRLRENEAVLLVSWSHTARCFNRNRASKRQNKADAQRHGRIESGNN
jgi:hypothetical protein